MASVRCPICERRFESQLSRSMPFCSERCRLVDLGRWLKEEYGVPVVSDDDEDELEYLDEPQS